MIKQVYKGIPTRDYSGRIVEVPELIVAGGHAFIRDRSGIIGIPYALSVMEMLLRNAVEPQIPTISNCGETYLSPVLTFSGNGTDGIYNTYLKLYEGHEELIFHFKYKGGQEEVRLKRISLPLGTVASAVFNSRIKKDLVNKGN
jgi:hypothetical protein